MAYRLGEPLDYEPAAIGDTEPEAPAAPAGAIPEPEEIPATVIPKVTDIPKFVYEGDEEKAKPKPKVRLGEALDYEPQPLPTAADKGSFIPEAAKGVAAGATEYTGAALRGAGGIRVEDMQRRLDEQARAAELEKIKAEGLVPEGALGPAGIVNFDNMSPLDRKEIEDRLAAATKGAQQLDLAKDPFFTAGLATNEWSAENFKAAKDYEDSWTRAITTGLGSIVPLAALTAVPGGSAAAVAFGVAGSTGEAIDRAIAAGASKEDLMQAIRLGGVPGLTDQASVEVLLGKIPLPAVGKVLGAFGKIAAKMAVEGGQEALQQGMQNAISKYVYKPDQDILEGVAEAAGIGAIVGGIVGAPEALGKKDETDEENVDEAGEAAVEGVNDENAVAAAAAGTATPGGVGAATATPPPGVVPETPAAAAPAATSPVDPTIAAGLAAETAPTPPTAPAVAGAGPATPEISDIEEEVAPGVEPGEVDEGAAALAAATRDMYARETAEAAREAKAASVTVADTNSDVVAALNEVTKGQKKAQRAARAQKETVGTGQALTTPIVPPGQPAATQVGPEAAAPGIPPSPPAPPAAPVAAAPVPPTPPVAAAPTTTRDERREKLLAGAPAGIREMLGAPAAPQPDVSLTPAPAPNIPVAPIGEITAEPTLLPEGELPANVTLGPPLDYEPAPIPTEGAAAPTPVSAPTTPGAKGAAVKRKKKTVTLVPKAAPAEVVKREDVGAWLADRPKAEAAPAAPAEAAAPQTKMTRDAAAFARSDPRLQKAIEASEATNSLATTEEVAAEVLHKHGRQGRSPREIIEGHVDEIVAEVERRLASKTEAVQEERVAAVAKRENKIDRSDKEAAAERKTKEMAVATAPQKKERAGKHKGKSPEGILTQSDESWEREEERQLKKKPEERDQRVMKYAQLVREEKKISTPERKKEIAAEKQSIKEAVAESRRAELEAKAKAPKEISPEAHAKGAKIEEVLKTVPMPPSHSNLHQLERDWHANLLAFLEGAKGIVTGKNIVRSQSNAENLLIWARKLRASLKAESKSEFFKDIFADGIAEYQMARFFHQQGATEELNTLLGTEKIKGEEYQEGALGGEDTDVSELLDEGLAAVRSTEETAVPTTDIEGGGGQLAPEPSARAGRKGGARGATGRWYNRARRVAKQTYGLQQNVVLPTSRGMVSVEAYATTGNKILDDIKAAGNEDLANFDEALGFMSFFRDMHLKRLRDLVGDIKVYVVDDADMTRIMGSSGTGGVHMGYSNAAIAQGYEPYIVLNASYVSTEADMAHVAMHELTHAATIQAYRMNVRGTQAIIRRLREGVLHDLRFRGVSDQDLRDLDLSYGLLQGTDEDADLEFIAEAFSNPRFQAMLAQFNVDPKVARDVAALATKGRLPTWWEAFTAGVSNALGMIKGQRGMTYMEQMIAVHPHIMRSIMTQQRAAERETYGAPLTAKDRVWMLPRAVAHGPTDVLQFNAEFKQQFEGWKAKLNTGWATVSTRGKLNMVSTTGELQRKAAKIMGGFINPFNDLAELLMQKDPLRSAYRAMGQPVEEKLIRFKKANREAYEAMSKFLGESARFRLDPRYALSHVNNKHVSKTGARGEQSRAMHAKLAEEWAKLPAEARAIANETVEHFRKMHDMDSQKTIKLAFTNAFTAHHKDLPAGKTMDDAIEWVRSGGAARKLEERTAEDVQWHKALGNTAETLANIPHLRRLEGIYVPLARRGKFFISGFEKLAKPAKGIFDPSVKGDNKNKFIFSNEQDAREYMASTEYLARLTSRWIDPTTGGKIEGGKEGTYTKADGTIVYPKQQFFVTVQNNFMMMDDNQVKLQNMKKELEAGGHTVKQPALTQQAVDDGGGDITTAEMQALLRNLKGTTIGNNTIGQQAVQNAVIEAQIRAMSTPGILSRHLRQKGVLGYDLDLAAAAREYNRDMASHLANIDLAPQMAAADKALMDHIEGRRGSTSGEGLVALQQLRGELKARINDKHFTKTRDNFGGRLASAAMNITYMRHLASPHYTIVQMLQPLMTTYPILAAKYGDAAAWREMKRFYGMRGGVRKALAKGLRETGAAALNLNPFAEQRVTPEELAGISIQDKFWLNHVADEPDGGELQALLLKMHKQGLGAASGIEAGYIAQQDLTAVERGLQRGQNVAKGMPEAAEGIARTGAAVMTYRLSRAKGNSIEEAQAEAVNAVEQTQGGYSRANNPAFFNNPLLRFPLQFKRYGLMFAQMYYGSIVNMVAKDPEARRIARKSFARLSATTFLFAGIGGLPLAEVARIAVNIAVALGIKDDDWEKDEGDLEEWFNSMLGWASGSEGLGNKVSEAAFHGLTRLVGADTSGTMGAENLLTFGQPNDIGEEDSVKSWVLDMALGASGKTVLDTYHAATDLDVTALPWPKIMQNIMDAIELTTVGTVDPDTGEQYMEPVPIHEGIIKGFGFRTASQAEEWEPGGGGYEGKQEKRLRRERREIMERWSNATGAAKDRAREEAREFSKRQTDRKMRIDAGDLYRSKRERERQRKEREKKREES